MPVCPANNATTGESYLEKKNQTLYPRNRTVCNELRDVGYQSRPRNERGDHYLSFFSSYCTDKTPRTLMDNTRRKERKKERKILNEIKKRERDLAGECGSPSFLRAGFPPLCSTASSPIPPRKPHERSHHPGAGINTCGRRRLPVIPQTGAANASAP